MLKGFLGFKSKGGNGTPSRVRQTPSDELPEAKPFSDTEFNELVNLMGGINYVKPVG